MTDRIEPAWNADMLSWIQNDPGDVRLALDRGMDNIAYDLKGQLPNLIALANAALSDDDPRKITREWVAELRTTASEIDVQLRNPHWRMADDRSLAVHRARTLRTMADALESYLPPETP